MKEEKKEVKEILRLSPSSIITYMQCPREFYYKYILRMPEPPSEHLLKGSIVHKVLELFYGKTFRQDIEVYIIELFDRVWAEYEEKWDMLNFDDDRTEAEKNDCRHILNMHVFKLKLTIEGLMISGKAKGFRHAWYTLRPKLKEIWYEDKELGLCGMVDTEHEDFDGNVIQGDYKTSAHYGIGMKNDYEIQMSIYGLLYYRKHGKIPTQSSVIFLRYGLEVVSRMTPYRIKKALELVKYVRKNTMSRDIEDYPCSDHKLCSWSSFFDKKTGLHEVESEERRKKALEEFKKNKEEKNND